MAWWLIAAAVPLFNGGTAPLELRSRPGLRSARACSACHVDEAAAWEASAHHRSATNRRYEVAIAAGPSPWCKNCHEPLGSRSEGVSCAVCHVRDDLVLSRKKPSAAALEAHPVKHEPSLGSASFCAGCHDFRFPTRMEVPVPAQVEDSPEGMQTMWHEWQQSFAAKSGQTCQSCHMPRGSHHFPTQRHLNGLRVDVVRTSESTIDARISLSHVGHAFPSGDPFRRAILELCADEGCATIRARYELARQNAPLGERFTYVSDTRIEACGEATCTRALTFTLREPVTHWQLRYLYADPRNEHRLERMHKESLLARGAIGPEQAVSR